MPIPTLLHQFDNTASLTCPRCGSEYLHHDCIEIFERREDAEYVNRTAVRGKSTIAEHVPNDSAGNPSARRHGLRIHFYCEECGDGLALNLAQHKGITLVDWAIGPISETWRRAGEESE